MNHHSTQKGKTVFVILKSGEIFEDKFIDKKARFIFFQTRGKIAIKDIKVFTIRRNKII